MDRPDVCFRRLSTQSQPEMLLVATKARVDREGWWLLVAFWLFYAAVEQNEKLVPSGLDVIDRG